MYFKNLKMEVLCYYLIIESISQERSFQVSFPGSKFTH